VGFNKFPFSLLVFSLQPCNPHPSEIPNFSNPVFFPKTPTPKRKDQRMVISGNSTTLFSWPFPSLKWPRNFKKIKNKKGMFLTRKKATTSYGKTKTEDQKDPHPWKSHKSYLSSSLRSGGAAFPNHHLLKYAFLLLFQFPTHQPQLSPNQPKMASL
jgi:hypothetical protein